VLAGQVLVASDEHWCRHRLDPNRLADEPAIVPA